METENKGQPVQQINQVLIEADETPTIGQLAGALAKAQGAMKPAAKDKKNPHLGNQYADLASVWDACREPLAANGLAVIQRARSVPDGIVITTTLAHASGEWVRNRLLLPVSKRDAQGIGSTITYGRRYALAAMVGVAAEDDDAEAAVAAAASSPARKAYDEKKAAQEKKQTKEQVQAAQEKKAEQVTEPAQESKPANPLRQRVRVAWETAQRLGMTTDGFRTWAKGLIKIEKPSTEWTEAEVETIENGLKRMIAEDEDRKRADLPQ